MERQRKMTGSDEQSERTRTADGTSFPSPRPRGVTPAGPALADAAKRPLDARHELISSLARTVTGRLDLADVLAATLSELRTLISFTGGSIQLVDDEGWIRLAAADPAAADELFDVRIPLDSTVAGRIVLTERPVYLPDIHAVDTLASPPPKANLTPDGVRSYFGVPLLAEGRAIGVLQLDSNQPAAWDDTERMLVVCVAPVVAAAIQNARAQARVIATQSTAHRIIERWRVLTQLLEGDVDVSLRGLVEMAEYVPAMRDEVDRLTAAIACVRAVAANAEPSSVDLRQPAGNANVSAAAAQ
jgi:GAF domain-containing protein